MVVRASYWQENYCAKKWQSCDVTLKKRNFPFGPTDFAELHNEYSLEPSLSLSSLAFPLFQKSPDLVHVKYTSLIIIFLNHE